MNKIWPSEGVPGRGNRRNKYGMWHIEAETCMTYVISTIRGIP